MPPSFWAEFLLNSCSQPIFLQDSHRAAFVNHWKSNAVFAASMECWISSYITAMIEHYLDFSSKADAISRWYQWKLSVITKSDSNCPSFALISLNILDKIDAGLISVSLLVDLFLAMEKYIFDAKLSNCLDEAKKKLRGLHTLRHSISQLTFEGQRFGGFALFKCIHLCLNPKVNDSHKVLKTILWNSLIMSNQSMEALGSDSAGALPLLGWSDSLSEEQHQYQTFLQKLNRGGLTWVKPQFVNLINYCLDEVRDDLHVADLVPMIKVNALSNCYDKICADPFFSSFVNVIREFNPSLPDTLENKAVFRSMWRAFADCLLNTRGKTWLDSIRIDLGITGQSRIAGLRDKLRISEHDSSSSSSFSSSSFSFVESSSSSSSSHQDISLRSLANSSPSTSASSSSTVNQTFSLPISAEEIQAVITQNNLSASQKADAITTLMIFAQLPDMALDIASSSEHSSASSSSSLSDSCSSSSSMSYSRSTAPDFSSSRFSSSSSLSASSSSSSSSSSSAISSDLKEYDNWLETETDNLEELLAEQQLNEDDEDAISILTREVEPEHDEDSEEEDRSTS